MSVGQDPAVLTWMIALSPRPRPAPTARHWWRELVVSEWRHAYDQWLIHRNYEASGYDTEEREFGQANPVPRLSDFMKHLSQGALAPGGEGW